jgi:hypothetical protein
MSPTSDDATRFGDEGQGPSSGVELGRALLAISPDRRLLQATLDAAPR